MPLSSRVNCHLLALMSLWIIVLATPLAAQPPAAVKVVRVLDGDTMAVTTDGTQEYRIRLIGVSAPELNSIVPCAKHWAEESTRYVSLLVTGIPLRLEFDVVPQDQYGRWLVYAYVEDLMVNALLIQYGLAAEVESGRNKAHRALFKQLEREAQVHRRGMWGP